MSDEAFKKFLKSEAEKSPFKLEGYVNESEVQKDTKRLADSITNEDYEAVKEHWRTRSFMSIAFILRKYGLEFKGITYMERLMEELTKLIEKK
jgi:ribosomal protein S25